MGLTVSFEVLNQLGTPLMYSATLANRPAFGIAGRIFFRTDSPYGIYRDTGTAWDLIAQSTGGSVTGSGTVGTLPIWNTTSALGDSIVTQSGSTIEIKATGANDSVLNIDTTTGDYSRIEFQNAGNLRSRLYFREATNQLSIGTYNTGGSVEIEVDNNVTALIIDSSKNSTFSGYVSAVPTLTAANNASSVAINGVNTLSYAAAFSANNIGVIYGAITGFNLQTFAGSATFANSNVASGGSSVNSIDFSSGGSTITMTQSSGIRVMSGQQNLFQYQGTNSGTITHAAISQNTGFYRPSSATGILTITNAYSHLINALDDYGTGFTFTNRWGIYQAGASDINYFAANMLVGSTTNNGSKLQVTGASTFSGSISTGGELNVGIGGLSSDRMLQISGNAFTSGANQYAAVINPTFGNTITDVYGLYISLTSGTSITNRYSIYLDTPAGSATNDYAIYSNNSKNSYFAGNLGLAVIPSAWNTTFNVMQIGSTAAFVGRTSGIEQAAMSSNSFFEATTNVYKYLSTAESTLYEQSAGIHRWRSAPSGTAGNTITYTTRMTLKATGILNLSNVPASSAGLVSGDIFQTAGVLNIVP